MKLRLIVKKKPGKIKIHFSLAILIDLDFILTIKW